MENYIDIKGDYRISAIGDGSDSLMQAWKKIKGGSYRKMPLQIGCLREMPFEEPYTEFLQKEMHKLLSSWTADGHSKQGTIIDPVHEKVRPFMSVEELLKADPDLNDSEIPLIFYPTK